MSSVPVCVVIPAYRDTDLLRRSIPALLASEGVALDVVIVNNDPDQDVAGLVEEQGWRGVRVLEPGENTGYTGAANSGIAASDAPYILIGNDDLFVTPGFIAGLAGGLCARPGAGAVGGKVLRYDLAVGRPTTLIDSAGIALRRSRGSYDRGEGQEDRGQFDTAEEVFALTGAALMLRREALEDIAVDGAPFDPRFFMYKEDVDLCWRLRLRGWECWYLPGAVAYHGRTSKGLAGRAYIGGYRAYLAGLRAKPPHVRERSLRNQWLMVIQDEPAPGAWPDLPAILGREVLALGANLVVAPATTLRSVVAFARMAPGALRRRRTIQARRAIAAYTLRGWVGR